MTATFLLLIERSIIWGSDGDMGDESGDEERGRASAFIGGRVPPRKLVQDWFQGKQELQPSLSSGKKKRKKRKKSGLAE